MGPSATLSLVAHLALIGAAVRGTAINARALDEAMQQIIAYLPPPDRRGSRENTVERLEYVEVGGGAPVLADGRGQVSAQGGPRPDPKVGDTHEVEAPPQEKSFAEPSQDSVYSVLEVEERAIRTTTSAAPSYPDKLMKDGTEGGVLVRFVVDTTGRADPNTLEIIRSTHPLFTASVREAVPQMAFTPAMVGGRHVRQAVEQNFEFRIVIPPPVAATKTRKKPVP